MNVWARLLRVAVAACALVLLPQAGNAEKRAFVAGINAYDQWTKLKTAINDANAVAELLRGANFTVTRVIDSTHAQFEKDWQEADQRNDHDVARMRLVPPDGTGMHARYQRRRCSVRSVQKIKDRRAA